MSRLFEQLQHVLTDYPRLAENLDYFGVGAALLAGVYLLLLLRRGRGRGGKTGFRRGKKNYVVIDGSNILYWKGEKVSEVALYALLVKLKYKGLVPVVWFDANAGYLLEGRYMGPDHLARKFDLASKQVHVAPKGMPADPLLLAGAAKLNCQVISNDRFRDWQSKHPILREGGRLVKGSWRDDKVVLQGLVVREAAH
ncbi:hypothetical protein KO498_16680 [Lentibacter algarum]|uniref:NYN domain-containing protein n=1 Tax=Lentibacter algarum TaxID=576131 RepID=UPI001C09EF4F|nr:hypothetical protein [Lentibacter algarum]MBU2983443.1 hypothetical protein [Lentibacter algarum]